MNGVCELIELAKQKYHIIAVAIDGYNPDEKNIHATTAQHEAGEIAEYLVKNFNRKIDILYGASIGGVYTLELLEDKRISFDTIILNGLSVMRMPKF